MKKTLSRVFVISFLIILGYSIRGLWIKGLITEKKARLVDGFLDQSFSNLGLKPEHLIRHFYEERRVGLKKIVHTTKIFSLPQHISLDSFYKAILDALKNSNAQMIEKTNFEIGEYSVSVFILGRRSISTHLIIGVAGKAKEKAQTLIYKKEDIKEKARIQKDKVAIIIDDVGYNMKDLEYLNEIDAPLTLAILPKLQYSKELAIKAHNMGYEIMLHLPLEPEEDTECLGPGAIFLNMTQKEIEKILDEDLETVPFCRGINNHAGSRFTSDPEKMGQILGTIKEKGFFL